MKKNRRKILSGSRKIFFAILAMFLSLSASAQQITASGQVLDAQKEPLIGVSVQEKGTSNGAITDLDGNFTLNVKQNAILIFSYVGYKSQEVKAAQQMKITLQEDNEVLDEVVVIGYGSVKRKDVTTAISSVSTRDLDMRPIVSAGLRGEAWQVHVGEGQGAETVYPFPHSGHRLRRGRNQGGAGGKGRTPPTSEAAAQRTTLPVAGGHSGKNGSGQKCRLQKVGNEVQPERDVQDAAVFAGAEDQQCRRTAGTSSGGNRTLPCHEIGRAHV